VPVGAAPVQPDRRVIRLQDAKALAAGPAETPLAAQFTAMLENIGDYLYFKDRHHVFSGASQSLVRLTTGGARHWSDLIGQTDYDVFPRAYADAYYRLEKAIFSGKVSINSGSKSHFDSLPGIGPVLAQRIIDHRSKNGPFLKVEDIQNVSGIGASIFAQISDRLTL
jgi:competence ComEA-like helix-hairpin-helix protein